MTLLKQLIEDESAVSITHYSMLLAIVGLAAVGAMNVFMTSVGGMVDRIGSFLEAA